MSKISSAPEQDSTENKKEPNSLLFRLWSKFSKQNDTPETQEDLKPPESIAQEQQPAPKEPAYVQTDSLLYSLWNQWASNTKTDGFHDDFILDFENQAEHQQDTEICTEAMLELERKGFEKELQMAAAVIKKRQQTKEDDAIPTDAVARVRISKNKMFAWMFIFAPTNGGADLAEAQIYRELANQKITYGILPEELQSVVSKKEYYKIITIARGVPAVHGQPGSIIDHFPRVIDVKYKENKDGSIDFKEIINNSTVQAEQILCDIIPPTEGVDGANVKGEILKGNTGKTPPVPKGTNTALSEDGKHLIASIEGAVSFSKDKFNISNVLVIEKDVDISTGNIDYPGSVIIRKDIREGFVVRAKGSVTVSGAVENASIYAGGDITITQGLNGNFRGELHAGGNITSKYIEKATVHCKGSIFAESVTSCDLYCAHTLQVTSNQGIILGGKIRVLRRIEAKIIGSNKTNKATEIIMGDNPEVAEQKRELDTQLKTTSQELFGINNSLEMFDILKPEGMTAQQKLKQKQLLLKKSVVQMQESQLQKQIEEIAEQIVDLHDCRIKCKELYPMTKIKIGDAFTTIKKEEFNCHIYYADGVINIGR